MRFGGPTAGSSSPGRSTGRGWGTRSRALHMPIAGVHPGADPGRDEADRGAYRAQVPEASGSCISAADHPGAPARSAWISRWPTKLRFHVLLVQPCPELRRREVAHRPEAFGGHVPSAQSRSEPGSRLEDGQLPQQPPLPAEARSRGADDVVILNLAGEVDRGLGVEYRLCEVGGRIVTPPLSAGILGGITRKLVLGGIAASPRARGTEETVRPVDLHLDGGVLPAFDDEGHRPGGRDRRGSIQGGARP
jgi:hypothetical protein